MTLIKYLAELQTFKRQQIRDENLLRFSTNEFKTGNKVSDAYREAVYNWKQTTVYSMSEFSDYTKLNLDFIKGKTRKWKQVLKNAFPLIHFLYFQNKNNNGSIKEIYLSSYTPFLVERIGTAKSVNKYLLFLCDLGVIKRVPYSVLNNGEYKENYTCGLQGKKYTWCREHGLGWGAEFTSKLTNVAYHYIINPESITYLYNLCCIMFGKYIWKTPLEDVKDLENDETFLTEYNKVEPVLRRYFYKDGVYCPFRPNFRIPMKYFSSQKFFKLSATKFMYDNDTQFKYFSDLRIDLNKNIIDEDLKGVFEPTFTFSKSGENCVKIGIRNHSNICSFKTHEYSEQLVKENGEYIYKKVKNDNYTGKYFYTELKNKFNWDKKDVKEYDRKGSVLATQELLTYGNIVDNNTDMYEKVFGVKFPDKFVRKLFKGVTLPAMFTFSIDQYINNSKLYFTHDELLIAKYAKYESGEKIWEDHAGYIWNRIHSYFPDINGTMVFYVESCIFMLIEKWLQEHGILEYVIKYDAVYLHNSVQFDFNSVLRECSQKYKDMFLKDVKFISNHNIEKDDYIDRTFAVINSIDNMRI